MKPKTLTISRGAKFSKNYNTVESHIIYSVELEEKDILDEIYEIASKSVSDMALIDMTTQINEMEEIRKKKGF